MYQISNVDFEEIIANLQEFSRLTYTLREKGESHKLINQGRKAAVMATKLKRKMKQKIK